MKNLGLLALTVSLLLFSGCASLEERLCNSTTAFQKGYDDVINGRKGGPGLVEGQSCKNSKNYAYDNYYRDYMAGVEKAKLAFCTKDSATAIGKSDADSGKVFKESLGKLDVCLADEKIKVNLASFYEVAFRKEFCQVDKVQSMAQGDAVNWNALQRNSSDFDVCAYQKVAMFKTYKDAFAAETRKQCTSSRAASLGITHARERKNMSVGLSMLDRCPNDLVNNCVQAYTAAYQSERSTMMDEERLRLEQQRLDQEDANRRELLRLQKKQLDLQQQQINQQQTNF